MFVVNEKKQSIQLICPELKGNLKVHSAMKCVWIEFQEPFKEKNMYLLACANIVRGYKIPLGCILTLNKSLTKEDANQC